MIVATGASQSQDESLELLRLVTAKPEEFVARIADVTKARDDLKAAADVHNKVLEQARAEQKRAQDMQDEAKGAVAAALREATERITRAEAEASVIKGKAEADIRARQVELDDLSADLGRQADALRAQNAQAASRETAVAVREASLDERDARINAAEAAVAKQAAGWADKERALQEALAAAAEREAAAETVLARVRAAAA